MTITYEQFRKIMPTLDEMRAQIYYPYLIAAMREGEITTPLRQAAFLAQVAHESGQLRHMAEIWGPTEAQQHYDPPYPKAKELGNEQPGDGKRYKGRSPIQLTGKANYIACGQDLGLDLEHNPELAAKTEHAFRITVWFWTKRKLNELADAREFKQITHKINGGYNGQDSRQRYYDHACAILGVK